MKLRAFLSVMSCVLLAACNLEPQSLTNTPTSLDPQANYWQQLDSLGAGGSSSLVTDGTRHSIAYSSYSDYISVRQWRNSNWWTISGTLNGSSAANSNAYEPSLALSSSGSLVVAWAEYDGAANNIYVRRYNGSSWNWISVGAGLLSASSAPSSNANNPSLGIDSSDNPMVAWSEFNGSVSNIYVQRFVGGAWSSVGTGLLSASNASNSNANTPSLAVDSSGNAVVAWSEYNGAITNVYVRRFDGSSWVNVGTGVLSGSSALGSNAENPSLALDSSNNPVVAWSESDGSVSNIYVQRFDGSTWVNVGTGVLSGSSAQGSNAHYPSLALDSLNNPMVAWYEWDGASNNLYVQQYTGSGWVNVGVTPLDTSLGQDTWYPSLSIGNGSPVVAWQEGNGTSIDNLYAKSYVTNVWQDLGSSLDFQSVNSAINSVVARTPTNAPVVAWDEFDSGTSSRNVYVKEWTGSSWRLVGGALDRTLSNDAENPSLVLRTVTNNRPTVAFQENNNVYVRWWNGSSWVNVSEGAVDTNLVNDAVTPSLALETPRNYPVVAYAEDGNIVVKRANGVNPSASWLSPYGTAPLDTNVANGAFRPSLALKSDNKPIVAWYEDVGTSFNIYVKEWNGSAWVALGGSLDKAVAQDARDIVLAIRTDNRPVVAWEEAGNIFVKQWTGTSWVSLGGIIDKTAPNQALRPSLDLRSDNNPVVTWQEFVSHPHSGPGSSYHVYVKRWTGSAWTLVANVVDKSVYQDAERPSLVLKSDNNPIISWDEWDGTSENVYVRQF
jgi:hypothetical protein